ncbi:disease resistance protein RPP13-like [Panicum miliaceum]|uniref:Disease resistance protein RPP13-like n=1 Tax=Panicum miliaceum TaxID=4540 RepID=A0A3L6PHB0_PANMI|nr:disease resistance protein RPP13-like [Panicum miliaceum]
MAEVMASAATGVMGSVIGKLTAMLGQKYQLARDAEEGIRFLKEELSTMDAALKNLAEKDDDQIDPLAKDWRSKVRELSYDIEDCIDRFRLNHSHGGSKANFVRKAVRKSERAKRYDIHKYLAASPLPVLFDLRAPALFAEARDLVGIDGPCKEIIELLTCEEMQHKVVSIYGTAGQGKTTLAMEVYRRITEAFDCRAFVSVSQTPDIKKLLSDILSQISNNQFDDQTERWEMEQLIRNMRDYLIDKSGSWMERIPVVLGRHTGADDVGEGGKNGRARAGTAGEGGKKAWLARAEGGEISAPFNVVPQPMHAAAWELIESALPRNDNGSIVITTTRSKTVAKSCCAGIGAHMYEAQPLGDDDSQRLFFKRLFCSREDCPQDLRKVSRDILKKCGGLPLAIISIAGLLANKMQTVKVWVNTLKSISAAVDKDSHIDKMKRILLLSYFDLPPHLKSCLLYLSVFPEDYLIDCRELILLWVAEALIPGRDRESMEQLGRSYLNDLINRSLVQPAKVGVDGSTVKTCRVHDVILEFIVSKAVEDNFVTIWNRNGFSQNYTSNKIRRLSIQEDISGPVEEMVKTIKHAHIRSINIFCYNNSGLVKHASKFLSNQVLRVLNIRGRVDVECYLGQVKRISQMKYFGIITIRPWGCELPEDLEKLHLETLDISNTNIRKLPASIIQLQRLVRLNVGSWVQLPDGIGNLQALEELSTISLSLQSVKFIQGLSDLANLKVLAIVWTYAAEVRDVEGHEKEKACICSLTKLFTRLRQLCVWGWPDATLSFMSLCVGTPPPLHRLVLGKQNHLSAVPHQISSLLNLTHLRIGLWGEVSKEGINILASLPILVSLTVLLLPGNEGESSSLPILGIFHPRYAINSEGFQRLVKFTLHCALETALEFEPGAMPKLQRLKLLLPARCQFKYGDGGLVLGLQNLAGLKNVGLRIDCDAATSDEVDSLEDDIRGVAGVHHNRPIVQVERRNLDLMAHGCSHDLEFMMWKRNIMTMTILEEP